MGALPTVVSESMKLNITTLLESVEATSLPRFLALVTVEWVALEVLMPLHGLGGI